MTRARDLADSADKDIAGTLTLDGLTVDGNVGIGTSSPDEKLEVVQGSGTTTRAVIGGGASAVLVVNGDRDNSGDSGEEDSALLLATDGVYDSSVNSGLGGYGYRVGAINDGGSTGLKFTEARNGSDLERMRIDSSGNVGIGTSSPNGLVELRKDSAAPYFVLNRDNNKHWGSSVSSSGNLAFQYGTSYSAMSSSTPALTLNSNGRVGIGTSSIASDATVHIDGTDTILLITEDSEGDATLRLADTQGNLSQSMSLSYDTGSTNSLKFIANGTSERMRIDASGNVGIGTTADQQSSAVNEGIWFSPGSNSSFSANSTPLIINRMGTGGNDRANITLHNNGTARADIGTLGASNGMYVAVGGSEAMRINSSGTVLVAKTASNSNTVGVELLSQGAVYATRDSNVAAVLGRTTTNGDIVQFRKDGSTVGSIAVTSSVTTYNTSSDRRLKDNIEPIADGTAKLMAMKPVTHTWIADPDAGAVFGFIAQEMQEIVPEAVSGDPDGEEMMSMDYGRITPVLVAALQEATNEIKALKQRLAELEAK